MQVQASRGYARGASGNVATEEVVYMLHGLGVETGVDLERLVGTAWFIAGVLGREPGGHVARALNPAGASAPSAGGG